MKKELKILMLEDSPTDAELIQRFLQKEYADSRFKLAVTRDGFLKALEEFEPDLILADNSLPQFDATEALRIVRERGSQIPFIMVSGTTKEEYAVQIIKSGADDYILKESLTRLPAAIASAFRHREAEGEKQEVLQALEQSEEKYRTIVDRISDGFMILDKQWQVIYANLKADDIFGKPRGFRKGKN
ncbi:MAG TPA: response regulator [Chitinophagaceae bacterium]|nr:response regulator [Chitinophagaceae bacterium]HPH32340.1 response regulator [Chitinophagaceae bacterium]HPN59170.1 response regulator [Chitinophagaceae bacterium]